MEKRKNMYEMSGAGDITKELNEIKKMQEDTPYVLSISTNTCGEFYTIICCQPINLISVVQQ